MMMANKKIVIQSTKAPKLWNNTRAHDDCIKTQAHTYPFMMSNATYGDKLQIEWKLYMFSTLVSLTIVNMLSLL